MATISASSHLPEEVFGVLRFLAIIYFIGVFLLAPQPWNVLLVLVPLVLRRAREYRPSPLKPL
jgi:1,4-dihydroxy-2-naphthoate octaprenyltransferase